MDCGDDEGLRAGEIVFRTLREFLILIKNQWDLFSGIMSHHVCRCVALKVLFPSQKGTTEL